MRSSSHQSTVATTAAGSSASTPRATLDSFEAKTVTVAAAKPAKHAAKAASTYYTVRSGDTLSKIASRFYHEASDWRYLYQANEKTVHNPDMIYAGERLLIPGTVSPQSAYTPKHSKAAATTETTSAKETVTKTTPKKTAAPKKTTHKKTVVKKTKTTTKHTTVVVQRSASGDYSCAGLEELWEQAGGSASTARMAAEIAKAESGGNPNAISPTDDYGLWQINAVNGSLATLSPTGNARSAVIMSDNGRDWNAWTTYHSGAYYGRC